MEKHDAMIVEFDGLNGNSECASTIMFRLVNISRRCLVQLEVSLSIGRS